MWAVDFASAGIDAPLDILAIAAHPDDVEQRSREPGELLLATAREGAQVAAGAPHPGDRVVDLVEALEPLRVVLVGFELVE